MQGMLNSFGGKPILTEFKLTHSIDLLLCYSKRSVSDRSSQKMIVSLNTFS